MPIPNITWSVRVSVRARTEAEDAVMRRSEDVFLTGGDVALSSAHVDTDEWEDFDPVEVLRARRPPPAMESGILVCQPHALVNIRMLGVVERGAPSGRPHANGEASRRVQRDGRVRFDAIVQRVLTTRRRQRPAVPASRPPRQG